MSVFHQVLGTVKAAQSGYAFVETFEGGQSDDQGEVGYDNTGWASSSAAAVTPRYATSPAPLAGTYSLRLESFGTDTHNLAAPLDTAEVYFMFNVAGFTTNDAIFALRDGSGTLLVIEMRAGPKLRVSGTGGTSGTAIGPDNTTGTNFSTGVTYYAWVKYIKGSGSNAVSELRISTTTTRPSATNSTTTNGTSTTQATALRLAGVTTAGMIFDNIVADTSVGSNPVP